MKTTRIIILIIFLSILSFAVYISYLYQSVEIAFHQVEESLPTQVYSDLTLLKPGLSKEYVTSRLNSLRYTTKDSPGEKNTLQFILRSVNYPTSLLPEFHPTLNYMNEKILLTFDGAQKESKLVSITNEEDLLIEEIYLEPEVVATWSRTETKEIRQILSFHEIPATVWKAIIAIEDQHFLNHQGFDFKAVLRAIYVNIKTASFAQGGSTITQQLVKNLTARRSKNILKKINELFLSIILEIKYKKEEILERYLNEVYLGQIGNLQIHGVAEGAQYFYGKDIHDLNLAEIALIAGIIRGPSYYSPYRNYERALERQKLVLKKMAETGQISEEEAKDALELPIRLASAPSSGSKAPFYADYVKAQVYTFLEERYTEEEMSRAGLKVFTSLDPYLSELAQTSVTEGLLQLEKSIKLKEDDRLEGVLAVVEHETGKLKALIGGRNYAQSNFNRLLNMKRQAGSTFKPIVFLSALLEGRDENGVPYGGGYPLDDTPVTVRFDRGKKQWSPKNYDNKNFGWTTFRVALYDSLNIATVRLGAKIGLPAIMQTAYDLGIETELPRLPSLMLGAAELSPMELLQAYSTLARSGSFHDFVSVQMISDDQNKIIARSKPKKRQVIDPEYVDVITDIMKDTLFHGTARASFDLGWKRPAAGKTGTTSDYRDSWFIGYSPHLTALSWVGFDKGVPGKVKLTGAKAALPIWVRFMKKAHQDLPVTDFQLNEKVIQVKIDKNSGQLASTFCSEEQTSMEKYPAENEPTESGCEEKPDTHEKLITLFGE